MCDNDGQCTKCRREEYRENRDHRVRAHEIRHNLAATETRTETLDGREYLVVPVVMARAGVVMNGSLVPEEEFFPDAWNGVPVTVGHPEDGGNVSANSPDIIENWAVGQIFNAQVSGGALRGEAWVDIEKANARQPGLIEDLQSHVQMDVSTGYFSKDEKKFGKSNGRDYRTISRDLLPDHLALLPGDVGACSWADGCGVRTNNERKTMTSKIKEALDTLSAHLNLKGNERGDPNDSRQIVADLISNDNSPFLPDDNYALMEMSYDSLVKVRDQFLGAPAEEDEGDKPNTNQEGGQELADKPKSVESPTESGLPKTVDELNSLIANAVTEATSKLTANALSDEDRVALAQARKITDNHRAKLVSTITANSKMTEEQLKGMDLGTLETIEGGLHVQTKTDEETSDFSGRPVPVVNSDGEEITDPAIEAMTPPSVSEIIANRRKSEVH